MTDVVEGTTPSVEQPKSRPTGVWLVVACVLLPALAVCGMWLNHKKPWLMDDYRAGYEAATVDSDLQGMGKHGDPCGKAMAARYGGEPRYVPLETPEDASAFYWGCWHGSRGVKSDWWNVSGYLTA